MADDACCGKEERPSKDFTTKSNDSSFSGEWTKASSLEGAEKAQPSCVASPLNTPEDLEFVGEAEEYHCPVCLSLMSEPHLTNCGHHFCKGCIEPIYQQAERECPICKEPGFRMMPDRDIERRMKSLKIHCVNRKSGCDWTGEIVYLEDHLLKRCDYYSVDCKFKLFGCEDTVLRKDRATHISDNIISHMTMVVERFEANQRQYDNQLSEKDAKISQLEQRINDFEATISSELESKSDIKWTPLHPWHQIYIVRENTPMGTKQCYVHESIVPNDSKEILVLISTHSEFSRPHKVTNCISVFVEEDGVRHSKFIRILNYEQRAWSDNTDNVWLPLPANRVVNVDVPVQFGRMFWCDVYLIGYR